MKKVYGYYKCSTPKSCEDDYKQINITKAYIYIYFTSNILKLSKRS